MDPYEALANAVIIQAAKDYRAARRKYAQLMKKKLVKRSEKDPRWTKWSNKKADIEAGLSDLKKFFYSEWFTCLSSTDGPSLYERLREEADADECEGISEADREI